MMVKNLKRYSCKLLLTTILGVSACIYEAIGAVDDDVRSVTSEDTFGGAANGPAGRGRSGWETIPDLTKALRDALTGHNYLPTPAADNSLDNKDFTYNTYPFDLPASNIETGTISLGVIANGNPDFVLGAALKPEIRKALRSEINQIIVTDFPDVSSLETLKSSFDHNDANNVIHYGLHFFGQLPDTQGVAGHYQRLLAIKSVVDAWGEAGSLAECSHIDFAIASPGTAGLVNLGDAVQRRRILDTVVDIVNSPGAQKLETLSLRFMHLSSVDIDYVVSKIQERRRDSFKRLILGFNDIDDTAMKTDGAISKAIADTVNLPGLQVVDLKGNNFTDLSVWDLDASLQTRKQAFRRLRIKPLLRLSNHGFTTVQLAEAVNAIKIAPLMPFTDFRQQEGFTPNDNVMLKRAYDGAPGVGSEFLNRWVLEQPNYRAIADELLLLRQGKFGGFTSLDLHGKRLDLEHLTAILAHASKRHPLIWANLEGSYVEGKARAAGIDDTIVDYLGTFPNLQMLDFSNNGFLNEPMISYGDLLSKLPRLRGLSFSDIGFGSHPAPDSAVNDHFGAMVGVLRTHRALRTLDYSVNTVNDADITMILPRLQGSHSLGFLSLAGDKIALGGSMGPAGKGTLLLNYLSTVNNGRAPTDVFKGIDLSGNPIPEVTLREVVGEYKTRIVANPAYAWPVLKIDGERADLTRTRVEYVSSAVGYLSLARAFDYNHLSITPGPLQGEAQTWINTFSAGKKVSLEEESKVLYGLANLEKTRERANIVYSVFNAAGRPAAIDVTLLPDAPDYKIHAMAVLETYKVPVTPDDLVSRAKLLKHVATNPGLFTAGLGVPDLVARESLLKTFSVKEQKVRIGNAIFRLIDRGVVPGPISNDTIVSEVLRTLI